jgi:predicted ferric reductase
MIPMRPTVVVAVGVIALILLSWMLAVAVRWSHR